MSFNGIFKKTCSRGFSEGSTRCKSFISHWDSHVLPIHPILHFESAILSRALHHPLKMGKLKKNTKICWIKQNSIVIQITVPKRSELRFWQNSCVAFNFDGNQFRAGIIFRFETRSTIRWVVMTTFTALVEYARNISIRREKSERERKVALTIRRSTNYMASYGEKVSVSEKRRSPNYTASYGKKSEWRSEFRAHRHMTSSCNWGA